MASSIILPKGYVKPGTGVDKRSGEELEVDPAAPRALTINQVRTQLAALAKKVGDLYGVEMSVALQNGLLYFVDGVGDRIVDRGGEREPEDMLCASMEEIVDGMFLKLFAGRANYAAVVERFNATSRGET